MKFRISFVFIFFYGIILSAQGNVNLYSFFVAGHTYGKPGVNNIGFHPPFKQKFNYIRSRPEIVFGVLTGDIVSPGPTSQDWDEIDADIDDLGLPVYFAVGNHDMENRSLFESRYGSTYYSFVYENDLFIVLDPNIDAWNITGDQLDFLKNTINNKAASSDHIYVFFHQILWKEIDNQFSYISWNSDAGRAATVNFWSTVMPLFRSLCNEVVMFAGDLGASWSSNVTYDRFDNITLIASGMGDPDGENFIVVNVANDKSVHYDLICLSDSNLNCLGLLRDYLQVHALDAPPANKLCDVQVFPNPASNQISIRYQSRNDISIQLLNIQGKLVLEKHYTDNKLQHVLTVSRFPRGLYFIRVSDQGYQSSHSLILK